MSRRLVLIGMVWLIVGLLPVTNTLAEETTAEKTTAGQITDLDQLLEAVRAQQREQRELNARREREFIQDKQRQQVLLAEAKKAFERSQRQNQPLLKTTEANAAEITKLEKQLAGQVESMGDIAATFREFTGDFAAVMQESMVTAQYPARDKKMQSLAQVDSQPTIPQIETLWLLLQEEMTAAARVSRFEATVVASDGSLKRDQVVRIGTFSAYNDEGFLRYIPETGELLSLSRQPAARYRNAAGQFIRGDAELATAVVDPTRGNLLGMMSYTPGLGERIEQGGTIAKIILALGAFGLLLTCWRGLYLAMVHLRVHRQRGDIETPAPSNPLGRVVLAADAVSPGDEELLQLKLDEAILAEIPALERGNGLIKLLAAISPLLGLLGTVTGMILTFQAISLYGTGDPKLMAGGISQALVTTVLGLVVAIPLLFGHNFVATLARSIIQRLDEQSAGILARRQEQRERK